jgi:hypothetical protein
LKLIQNLFQLLVNALLIRVGHSIAPNLQLDEQNVLQL